MLTILCVLSVISPFPSRISFASSLYLPYRSCQPYQPALALVGWWLLFSLSRWRSFPCFPCLQAASGSAGGGRGGGRCAVSVGSWQPRSSRCVRAGSELRLSCAPDSTRSVSSLFVSRCLHISLPAPPDPLPAHGLPVCAGKAARVPARDGDGTLESA